VGAPILSTDQQMADICVFTISNIPMFEGWWNYGHSGSDVEMLQFPCLKHPGEHNPIVYEIPIEVGLPPSHSLNNTSSHPNPI
jgi:hypothetical protein